MAASTVVTVGQLSQVATAQKTYIDAKDAEQKAYTDGKDAAQKTYTDARESAIRTDLAKSVADGDKVIQDQLDALEIPKEATETEVKDILDIFAVSAD